MIPMRRKDRQITDPDKIDAIIGACDCCRIGFADEGSVYLVPLSFGYEKTGETRRFYFHGAPEGRKIRLIEAGHPVGFELDTKYELREAPDACGYTAGFQSVIGTGTIRLLGTEEEKIYGLRRIMEHATGKDDWTFPEEMLRCTAVFCLEVTELSCKEHT